MTQTLLALATLLLIISVQHNIVLLVTFSFISPLYTRGKSGSAACQNLASYMNIRKISM